MKTFKTSTPLLFILLLSPFVYSISFDEFLLTYNYSLTSTQANITNVSIQSCSNCDNLTIKISLQADVGDYEIYGFLDNKTSSISEYFFEQNNTIKLIFYPPFTSNFSDLWVKIFNSGTEIYFSNISGINISTLIFRTPNITVINESEEEGKLKLTLNVDVLREGNYEITAYLNSENETFILRLNQNLTLINNVSFLFDTGVDGNFTLSLVELNQSVFRLNYKTKNYLFSKIIFINDSLYDGDLKLTITIKNNTNKSFYLFDGFSTIITLGVLKNNTITFNGSKINESGLNGPYIVKAIIDEKQYSYQTSYYNYSDFQKSAIEETKTTLISSISGTLNKLKESAVGVLSSIFPNKDNETITATNITIESFDNDKRDNVNTLNPTILIKQSTIDKNIKNSDSSFLNNNLLGNLLTGNAVFYDSNTFSHSKLLVVSLVTLISITLFSGYFLLRRIITN